MAISNTFNLRGKKAKFLKAKKEALNKITENSVIFFRDKNFRAQGFIDVGVERWAPTKSGGKILEKTGRGRASIHKTRPGKIEIGQQYMRYHNTGTDRFVQRKFMGSSQTLDKENMKIVDKIIGKIF